MRTTTRRGRRVELETGGVREQTLKLSGKTEVVGQQGKTEEHNGPKLRQFNRDLFILCSLYKPQVSFPKSGTSEDEKIWSRESLLDVLVVRSYA